MSDEAATPTGGAEVSARPDASATEQKPQSITERLKASLFAPQEETEQPERAATPVAEPAEPKAPKEPVKAEAKEEVPEEIPAEDAEESEAEARYETLSELAEALGWDLEKVLDLEAMTKIDGKEGKARLRDLIKSHQLEGHLNQKLMTFADEKKAFEAERQTFVQTSQHKLQQMDAALQVAHRMLHGEFAQVDWQSLQNSDPLAFNQQYVLFQQRQAQLNHLAETIGHERKQAEAQAAQQQQAYLAEQMKLMESKIPEWNDKGKRDKDIAELIPVAKDAYGITEAEVRGLKDHREVLILRDAVKWQQLQKSKPVTLKKIKDAPKLIKPGSQQSQAAKDSFIAQKERERLRSTGKVSDAKAPLKRLLFNS